MLRGTESWDTSQIILEVRLPFKVIALSQIPRHLSPYHSSLRLAFGPVLWHRYVGRKVHF